MTSALSDTECAEIAAWAKRRLAETGEKPAIVVDRQQEPGRPQTGHSTIYVHPEDFRALYRWADAQEPWRWPLDV